MPSDLVAQLLSPTQGRPLLTMIEKALVITAEETPARSAKLAAKRVATKGGEETLASQGGEETLASQVSDDSSCKSWGESPAENVNGHIQEVAGATRDDNNDDNHNDEEDSDDEESSSSL